MADRSHFTLGEVLVRYQKLKAEHERLQTAARALVDKMYAADVKSHHPAPPYSAEYLALRAALNAPAEAPNA
jgi:hypothetical protein